MDFSGGYVPPGIYVDSQATGAFASVGIGATVVCLVGPGLGYQTITENVSFAARDALTLSKKYVDPTSIVVSAVLDTGAHNFSADITGGSPVQKDYSFSATNNVATITRHSSSGIPIPTDRLVQVSYHYADDDYFALNKFSDFATLASVYGNPIDPVSGVITSPLAFAAQQAFRNGANVIYCVAPDIRLGGSAETQQTAAYDKTLDNYEINLIVPVWPAVQDVDTATSYLADLSGHLTAAYADNKPRMALCGVGAGYTTTDIDQVAQSVQNKRIVLFFPGQFLYFNPVLGATVADGFYFAAGAAGLMVSNDVNRGLTKQTVNGFTAIPAGSGGTPTQKNTWASRGVSVVEMGRTGALEIRQGVTTDISDLGTREISVVRCDDSLFETIALTLQSADVIGDPITTDTPSNIKGLIIGALENCLAANIIQAYTDVNASQGVGPAGDPTVITVQFTYFPTYPLNYVVVTFTLDLSTGNLTTATATADNSGS